MRATGGQKGRTSADTDALRTKAALLFADGKSTAEVASELGITERNARKYKEAVAPAIREHAAATLDVVAQAATGVRERIAHRADAVADMLADAALGQLPLRDDDGEVVGIQRDPSMVNAQVRAGLGLLGFIVGTKLDVKTEPLSDETAAMVLAVAVAAKKTM